jgi:hypothetical protein
MPLERVYGKLSNDPWQARLKLSMDPQWNLIYQNMRVLTTGRVNIEEQGQMYFQDVGRDTDFMFVNYLVKGDSPAWWTFPTSWLGVVFGLLILTLGGSSYMLFRSLRAPSPGATIRPEQKKRRELRPRK